MKKVLSVFLAVILAVTVGYHSAVAAESVTKQPVGSYGGGSIENGITIADFVAPKTSVMPVSFTIGDLIHRYAVDVTFSSDTSFTFNTGSWTWNVNNLKYETSSTELQNTTFTIEVKNYSDMPVDIVGQITTPYQHAADAGITFAMEGADAYGQVFGNLASAFVQDQAVGTIRTTTMKANLSFEDPTATATYLINNKPSGATSILLGEISVTISKAANP